MIASFSWRHKKHLFVMLEYAFAVRKTSHGDGVPFFYYSPYMTWKGSTVCIKFAFKRFDMVIIPLFFKFSFSQSKICFFESHVVAVHMYITHFFLQSPLRWQSVVTLQFQSRVSCASFWTIFLLCPLIICDKFWVQLKLTLMVFLLKILCSLLEPGKCFSIKFRNIFATLVDTSKVHCVLNQMILRCRFRLALFFDKQEKIYVISFNLPLSVNIYEFLLVY